MSRLQELTELPDRDLLAAHCAGDADAFGELFRRHRDRMWAVALRTTRDPELAADAVQEAFLAAYRRADSFRGEAAVTTWLHRIVVNACLDRLRRIKPTVQLPDADLSVLADSHDHHAGVEVRLDVRQALDRLPEGQRHGPGPGRHARHERRRGRLGPRRRRGHHQVPVCPWPGRDGRPARP